jgi:TetR/AcrR family transcriptional regulator, transcriptional repressor for nem operon
VNRTTHRLMDLAEIRIRDAGYGGFSFRNLAADAGIKSASVHNHFPTKALMTAAVARRSADRFFARVVAQAGETPDDAIARVSISIQGRAGSRWAYVPVRCPRS